MQALIVFILLHLQRIIQRSIQTLNTCWWGIRDWSGCWVLLAVWYGWHTAYTCPEYIVYGTLTVMLTVRETELCWYSAGKIYKLHAQSWCLLLSSYDQSIISAQILCQNCCSYTSRAHTAVTGVKLLLEGVTGHPSLPPTFEQTPSPAFLHHPLAKGSCCQLPAAAAVCRRWKWQWVAFTKLGPGLRVLSPALCEHSCSCLTIKILLIVFNTSRAPLWYSQMQIQVFCTGKSCAGLHDMVLVKTCPHATELQIKLPSSFLY